MKYRVQERQVLVYSWDVDSDDLPPGESLEDALGAISGVPDDADCRMITSSTTHEAVDDGPDFEGPRFWVISEGHGLVNAMDDEQDAENQALVAAVNTARTVYVHDRLTEETG